MAIFVRSVLYERAHIGACEAIYILRMQIDHSGYHVGSYIFIYVVADAYIMLVLNQRFVKSYISRLYRASIAGWRL